MLTLWRRRKTNDHVQPKLVPVQPSGADVRVEVEGGEWAVLGSDLAYIGATDGPPVCSGDSGDGFLQAAAMWSIAKQLKQRPTKFTGIGRGV